MIFTSEAEFENALIKELTKKGWEDNILKRPSEKDLLDNWANILFNNNQERDKLNGCPLTDGEMQQIIEQIVNLKTPLKLNGFINGKTVSIKRDNEDDKLHFGQEVSLKIYDRLEIASGTSRYQIVQQPQYKSASRIMHDRRGDLMLLINGMPVIHIELKKTGVSVSQAYHQIEKYSKEGIFSGIFSLIQIFVAMEPNETKYFANPGPDGRFNKDYYFNWADFDNEPINNWKEIASTLLSIPMAHQLIGFYTVADTSDGVLKVMRSYQYYAANAISDKVTKTDWSNKNLLGGHIWHTTGSGKTMTSFKSAQLIANSKDADKVIFMMDRIELGTQSLTEYRGFKEDNEEVQATENTKVLVTKLKSNNPSDTLIVTSIQKMSRIKLEEGGLNSHDIEIMNSKRIVFIIDEVHRSTFGDMLINIKKTFPSALFFGFTGTPILSDNAEDTYTTANVIGDELHRYSIADGIRDKNVLGFDPYKVLTYKDRDLRREVALNEAKASDEEEAISNPVKKEVYYHFMNTSKVKMAGYLNSAGKYIKGIEDYLPKSQYLTSEHRSKVVKDIKDSWVTLSQNSKFHALFATSSIPEAIEYYKLIKKEIPGLKVSALFDSSIDNEEGVIYKEQGLIEIIEDYNKLFNMDFTLATHGKFKKDISVRLSHKEPYLRIEHTPEKQLDLLIVVNQMLTGFDSKWVNTLYLDKILEKANLIQAFSRTNRLFGPEKPFGTIKYYRKPHTMEQNIEKAFKLYSGDIPYALFVQKLDYNLEMMNSVFAQIEYLFKNAGVADFLNLPDDLTERGKFASLFKNLDSYLQAARIQGFNWGELTYKFGKGAGSKTIKLDFDENTYLILALRYKELANGGGGGRTTDVPFEIVGHLTEINTDVIDTEYMNSRFTKYLNILRNEGTDQAQIQHSLDELHRSFASLSKEEQKYANLFLNDVHRGAVKVDPEKNFRVYITEYMSKGKDDQIKSIVDALGVDEVLLREMMNTRITKDNINEYGRLDHLKNTLNMDKAKSYFEKIEKTSLPIFRVNIKAHHLLEKFITEGGFELND
ncbi:MAG: HsdR family type I site-specific deoxyribonuclease [Bacilli bacterium]|nr:HsdR family type I site-specific deoxyribonuclease [Bacilli bacterium]